ncbi:uncharacterized mitochondrial protein-like protein [Tanacetum coccineum]
MDRRPFNKSTTNKNSNLKEKVNTIKGDVTTAGPKAVAHDGKTSLTLIIMKYDGGLLHLEEIPKEVHSKDNMYSVDLKNIVPSGERKNRTLIEAARTMLADSKLPTTFWAEAVNTACYVQNRVLVIKPHNKTPYELFLGRKPALSFMRPFGCPVTILNTLDHLGKFDGKADEGFFVGYSTNSKAYRVFNNRTRIVEENLHVKFSEETPNIAGNGPNWLFDIDALTISMKYKPVVVGNQNNGNADSEVPNTEEPRVNQEQDANVNNNNNINTVSLTVSVADIENNVVDENIVYRCIDDPYMPNLEEIMDVKSTFLYGTIEEEVAWYETLSTYLLENGFRRGTIDKTLFIKKDKGDILLVQVYVDDIIFGSTKKSLYVEFEQIMHKRFQMSSMRELAFFLGLQMKQKDDGIFISQDKYVADILKKFDFTTVKTTSTPIETSKALLKDDEAKDVDVHLYKSMIGSLMYLTASRLDMMFVLVQGIHHLTWKLSLIVIMLEIALTGNPQQDVVNFLAKDETVYKEWEDIIERDVTTASSLVVEQDSGNINRTKSMATLNESFLQGTGSGSGPRLNLLMPVLVYAARHTLPAVRHKLMLPGITYYCWKPKESTGFEEIIDFLNASYDQYALTVNPTIYTTCIEQLWASAKAKIVNGERQIQALVDKKKVIITETSIRSDLKLDDTEGIDCLPTASIFAELERIRAKTTAWNEFSSIMASAIIFFLDKQVKGMTKHKGVYVTPSHTKKVFANMKRPCKGFSGRITPLFSTVMVQATDNMGADSATPTYSHSTPIISQPSSSKPQKKRLRMKQRKDNGPTEPVTVKAYVSTPSYDPPQSGEDSIQLSELMNLCTSLQEKVLDLEKAKTAQANEITILKKKVKQLEKRRKSRPSGLRRLRKGRKIEDLDTDAEVTLVNKTREMNDDNLMFDTVSAAETASVEISDELTLAQTLIEIKTAKPKPVTTAATTVTSVKDKGKGKMVEPKKPLKKKDQISLDEEMARNLEAHMQAELIEEERLARQKEEEANIALIESWDNTQAMIDADFELAQRLQA